MIDSRTKYWLVLAGAAAGAVLICAGLWLAALSNPKPFPLDVAADRQIHLLAAGGFACTIAGLGVLLAAVSRTTRSMPTRQRTNTNIGLGIGFVLQLGGLFVLGTEQDRVLSGVVLILASLPLVVWGCVNYAEGKGHPKRIGLLGVAGIFGLIVLMVLPERHEVTT